MYTIVKVVPVAGAIRSTASLIKGLYVFKKGTCKIENLNGEVKVVLAECEEPSLLYHLIGNGAWVLILTRRLGKDGCC